MNDIADIGQKLSGLAIGITILLLLLALVLGPIAMETFFATNTTNWSTSTVTVWNALPVISMVVILIGLFVYMRAD